MKTFIEVAEARDLINRSLPDPINEIVPLGAALGRVLLREVVSKEAVPPFKNSAMDGFAVRSQDLDASGGQLRIIGEVRAGAWPSETVVQGTAVRIMTGAPVPKGADCIVPVEWTGEDGGVVRIDRGIEAGRNVRAAGQDMKVGQLVLAGGRAIGPGEISALATLGFAQVSVGRRPRCAVIATGDELVDVGENPGPGQIRNSNGPALASRVLLAGGEVSDLLHARDDKADIERIIRVASEADILVFSGGVSMGDYDLVQEVLEDSGFVAEFWKVKQRPGKPLVFGMLFGKPVFGLPGNPVSSGVCFDQYVRPAIQRMQGNMHPERRLLKAVLADSFAKPAGLHVFARGVLESDETGLLRVRKAGAQGSHISMSLVLADCLVHLPAGWDRAEPGSVVDVELVT
ncbi:MAG: molybdopterin molybdotransferase [Rhodothermales bacterium]|jgi:molybdopterin molybdotransferase